MPPAPWAKVTTWSAKPGLPAAEGLDAVEHHLLPAGPALASDDVGHPARASRCPGPAVRSWTADQRAKARASWASWMRWTLSDPTTKQ